MGKHPYARHLYAKGYVGRERRFAVGSCELAASRRFH
jgi:hypothetical protein